MCGAEYEGFPADFKEYMQSELNWSQIPSPACFFNYPGWVFWRRQDDDPDPSLSYDNFLGSIHDVSTSLKVKQNIRYALLKMILHASLKNITHAPGKMILHASLKNCLVQFWAATTTSEGRILLTTLSRRHLCGYRMMSREYMVYGDEESGEEQLGVPGRVFLRKLPEFIPDVRKCTQKEYPQRDDAESCWIQASWALPVFEHSSHTCVGVLEIVYVYPYGPSDLYRENILGRMNDSFQEFGLRFFDGCENCESNSREKDNEEKRRIPAFRELKRVLTSVCKTHVLPLARTWVPCSACNGLMRGQLLSKDVEFCARKGFSLDVFSQSRHLRKGLISGRALSSPNMLYCSNITQLSIVDCPLVPNARECKFSGWFTIWLKSSYTGDEIYVLEFFLSTSSKKVENIWTTLSLILGTMDKKFKTFRLASGQRLEDILSIEVIDFQNDQKIHSTKMIRATRFLKDGGSDQESTNAIYNAMSIVSLDQRYILANNGPFQNGEETSEMGSSDWPSMDPEMAISEEEEEENLLENNGENIVTAERNITMVSRLAERQYANMVTIKATFNGNPMIKFRLSLSSQFLELEQEVDKRLDLKAGSYNVWHKDERNQSILIACDKDLQDCMSRCLDKTPVVYVLLELKQPITNLNLAN